MPTNARGEIKTNLRCAMMGKWCNPQIAGQQGPGSIWQVECIGLGLRTREKTFYREGVITVGMQRYIHQRRKAAAICIANTLCRARLPTAQHQEPQQPHSQKPTPHQGGRQGRQMMGWLVHGSNQSEDDDMVGRQPGLFKRGRIKIAHNL